MYWASQVVLVVKNLPANAGDVRNEDSIPRSGKTPWRRKATCSRILTWKYPMDRGAWQATVHGAAKSQTKLSIWLFAEEEEAWGEAGLSKVTEVSGKATPGGEAP